MDELVHIQTTCSHVWFSTCLIFNMPDFKHARLSVFSVLSLCKPAVYFTFLKQSWPVIDCSLAWMNKNTCVAHAFPPKHVIKSFMCEACHPLMSLDLLFQCWGPCQQEDESKILLMIHARKQLRTSNAFVHKILSSFCKIYSNWHVSFQILLYSAHTHSINMFFSSVRLMEHIYRVLVFELHYNSGKQDCMWRESR